MVINLEEYLKDNHKDIYGEYLMYCRKDKLPEIGQKVKIKNYGYGYGRKPGDILTVTDIVHKGQISDDGAVWGDNYIVLNNSFLCPIINWWKEIEIIN